MFWSKDGESRWSGGTLFLQQDETVRLGQEGGGYGRATVIESQSVVAPTRT